MDKLIYTGVGSRKTPLDILSLMTRVAQKLSGLGYCLRSGGAVGADSAFEKGAVRSEIYYARHSTKAAEAIAAEFHPVWNRLSPYVRQLHGRNAFQVLGSDLRSPSEFLVCWTQDGCISHSSRSVRTGGTGTAISIANANGVTVFNLARPEHRARLERFVEK